MRRITKLRGARLLVRPTAISAEANWLMQTAMWAGHRLRIRVSPRARSASLNDVRGLPGLECQAAASLISYRPQTLRPRHRAPGQPRAARTISIRKEFDSREREDR